MGLCFAALHPLCFGWLDLIAPPDVPQPAKAAWPGMGSCSRGGTCLYVTLCSVWILGQALHPGLETPTVVVFRNKGWGGAL